MFQLSGFYYMCTCQYELVNPGLQSQELARLEGSQGNGQVAKALYPTVFCIWVSRLYFVFVRQGLLRI